MCLEQRFSQGCSGRSALCPTAAGGLTHSQRQFARDSLISTKPHIKAILGIATVFEPNDEVRLGLRHPNSTSRRSKHPNRIAPSMANLEEWLVLPYSSRRHCASNLFSTNRRADRKELALTRTSARDVRLPDPDDFERIVSIRKLARNGNDWTRIGSGCAVIQDMGSERLNFAQVKIHL
jgi:hypothetical protein